jgi:hypothetical protein
MRRMTLEWLKGLLDFRKLPWWLLGAVAAASGAALFLTGPAAKVLALNGAKDEHRFWLGFAFVLSSAALLLLAGGALWKVVAKPIRGARDHRLYIAGLGKLSREEKEVLRRYFTMGSKSQVLPYTSGVARSLEAAGIIYRASNVSIAGMPGTPFPYNLQLWAWDYLNAHPEVLADP